MKCKILKHFLLFSFLYSSAAPLWAMDEGKGYARGLLGKRKHEGGESDPFIRPSKRRPPFARAEDVPSPPPLVAFTPVKGVFDQPTPRPSPLVEFTRAAKVAQGINREGLSYDEAADLLRKSQPHRGAYETEQTYLYRALMRLKGLVSDEAMTEEQLPRF